MSEDLDALEEAGLEPGEPEVPVVMERLSRWERRIQAEITIPQPVEPIWQVLTDYEALADFIPNLAVSRRLAHPEAKIRLEQVGTQPLLKFNFRARVVVDIEEFYPQRIAFTGVEGDFSRFDGAWSLQPQKATATQLCYLVHLRPRASLPVQLIEGRITRGIQRNLLAIRERVNQLVMT